MCWSGMGCLRNQMTIKCDHDRMQGYSIQPEGKINQDLSQGPTQHSHWNSRFRTQKQSESGSLGSILASYSSEF